jgi:hypothetical protein
MCTGIAGKLAPRSRRCPECVVDGSLSMPRALCKKICQEPRKCARSGQFCANRDESTAGDSPARDGRRHLSTALRARARDLRCRSLLAAARSLGGSQIPSLDLSRSFTARGLALPSDAFIT